MKMNFYCFPNFTLSISYKHPGSILKLSTKHVLKSYPYALALGKLSDFFFLTYLHLTVFGGGFKIMCVASGFSI